MSQLITFEKQLKLVTKIISTTDELIPMLRLNFDLNETLHTTIDQIFHFLSKVINVLPETLLSTENLNELKEELIDESEKLKKAWKNFPWEPELFFERWDSFSKAWKNFNSTLQEVMNRSNTIYLSMN